MAFSHQALQGDAADQVKVTRALISVSDKTDVVSFGSFLVSQGVEILSTGGTAKKLREGNVPVIDVSEYTKSPEILNGRVKSLHPMIHGGLLAVRGNATHESELKEHSISKIDMVVCNLYPFSATVAKGADFDTSIENIDIGGPSMIRSAAKNNRAVAVLTAPRQYADVTKAMKSNDGCTSFALRKKLAAAAFEMTAVYDTAISDWFKRQI